jgi:S-DNA-T family DNA segregation ATPase FtsK/SpoIIIE
MIVVFLSSMIVTVPFVLLGISAVLAALVYLYGQRVRLDRQKERAYAAALLLSAGAWTTWAVLADGIKPYAALPLLTTILAIPWFRHRSGKSTIPVTISPLLKGAARHRAEKRANEILTGWPIITRQGRIQFADLDGLEFDAHTLSVDIVLRGGQSAKSLGYPTMRSALESAFNVPEGSMRPSTRGGKSSREATLLFILNDRNADSLGAAPEDVLNLGRFETGGDVEFDDEVHTVVAGKTGSGKSGITNQIIRRKVRDPLWAVVGIDLKPGGLELGPWEDVLAYFADTHPKALLALQGLLAGLTRRGQIMKERGWREWRATPQEPKICLVIDEVQQLRRIKGAMTLLEDLAALSRAYGFQLVIATQFPKDSNLPSEIMAQIGQVICGKLKAPKDDRVVYGENATAEGWTPSAIPDGKQSAGIFYIKSGTYTKPVRARGWFMTVDMVREEAGKRHRTLIDAVTGASWLAVDPSSIKVAMEAGDMDAIQALEDAEDIVDADLVDEPDAVDEVVLQAIRDGHGTQEDITEATGIPRRTVGAILLDLQGQGRISKPGSRATRARPWTVVE